MARGGGSPSFPAAAAPPPLRRWMLPFVGGGDGSFSPAAPSALTGAARGRTRCSSISADVSPVSPGVGARHGCCAADNLEGGHGRCGHRRVSAAASLGVRGKHGNRGTPSRPPSVSSTARDGARPHSASWTARCVARSLQHLCSVPLSSSMNDIADPPLCTISPHSGHVAIDHHKRLGPLTLVRGGSGCWEVCPLSCHRRQKGQVPRTATPSLDFSELDQGPCPRLV